MDSRGDISPVLPRVYLRKKLRTKISQFPSDKIRTLGHFPFFCFLVSKCWFYHFKIKIFGHQLHGSSAFLFLPFNSWRSLCKVALMFMQGFVFASKILRSRYLISRVMTAYKHFLIHTLDRQLEVCGENFGEFDKNNSELNLNVFFALEKYQH